ncbi:hypothetical protein J008_05660 [Cryptococcus neoformans]|nr:hypothetical protein C362_05895 [Cryptococcus neoformans var. grubii Bt1]OXG15375.1 hypothetical protein C367_05580 [Cryptococcus neoformans var. grubii Ze90-1]OXH24568.1 hypothetical protein J008_05660 [Cryptococcus neoformans var. grubii]
MQCIFLSTNVPVQWWSVTRYYRVLSGLIQDKQFVFLMVGCRNSLANLTTICRQLAMLIWIHVPNALPPSRKNRNQPSRTPNLYMVHRPLPPLPRKATLSDRAPLLLLPFQALLRNPLLQLSIPPLPTPPHPAQILPLPVPSRPIWQSMISGMDGEP